MRGHRKHQQLRYSEINYSRKYKQTNCKTSKWSSLIRNRHGLHGTDTKSKLDGLIFFLTSKIRVALK